MGLFDFVKDAGNKLLGDSEAEEQKLYEAAKKRADGVKAKIRAREAAKPQKDMAREEAIRVGVARLGLAADDLEIDVEDDKATVRGFTGSQVDREKIVLAIGNTQGIARVDDRIAVDQPVKTHTVVSGDTLSKIAKQHYGDPAKYPVIFEANKPMLSDPDKIYPGQVLRIPAQ